MEEFERWDQYDKLLKSCSVQDDKMNLQSSIPSDTWSSQRDPPRCTRTLLHRYGKNPGSWRKRESDYLLDSRGSQNVYQYLNYVDRRNKREFFGFFLMVDQNSLDKTLYYTFICLKAGFYMLLYF